MTQSLILADGRWDGAHGIGRFSREIISRLQKTDVLRAGPKPLSLTNFLWQPYYLFKKRREYQVFFTPGFNSPMMSFMPYVFTIHDLIHLSPYQNPSSQKSKKIF